MGACLRSSNVYGCNRLVMTFELLAARLILAGVFLMSAIPKLASPRQFAEDVQQYRMLPRPLASAFGYALPYAEVAASVLLLIGVYTAWAAMGVVVMLLAFMTAVGVAMARKLNLTCSCFGLLYRERVGWGTQIRDGILLGPALFILAVDANAPTLADMLSNPGRLGNALGLAFTVFVLCGAAILAYLSLRMSRRPAAHEPTSSPSLPMR